jgi:hypothetical protein
MEGMKCFWGNRVLKQVEGYKKKWLVPTGITFSKVAKESAGLPTVVLLILK